MEETLVSLSELAQVFYTWGEHQFRDREELLQSRGISLDQALDQQLTPSAKVVKSMKKPPTKDGVLYALGKADIKVPKWYQPLTPGQSFKEQKLNGIIVSHDTTIGGYVVGVGLAHKEFTAFHIGSPASIIIPRLACSQGTIEWHYSGLIQATLGGDSQLEGIVAVEVPLSHSTKGFNVPAERYG